MTIQPGERVPSVTVKQMTRDGIRDVTTDDFLRGRRVALFTVPAAFSPSCSAQHLPGYMDHAGALRQKGVDAIACVSVNDPFVMDAWAKSHGVGDEIAMLADGNAELARALGLDFDASPKGMGTRARRAALIIDDGVVTALREEDNPGKVEASSAETLLADLDRV